MQNKNYKLKPCPFCGGTNIVVLTEKELDDDPTKSDYVTVVCDYLNGGCGSNSGFRQTSEDAVALWNKRCKG